MRTKQDTMRNETKGSQTGGQRKQDREENEESDSEKETEKSDSATDSGPTFNYLLDMPLWYLTKEKKDELCKLRNEKVSCCWIVHVAWLYSNGERKLWALGKCCLCT